MKVSEIREMTPVEMNKKLDDLRKELFNLRFQHAVNQLDNPMRIKAVKKDIARIKTVIREQESK
ncbi:MAG: 50S ribosomal protein L29 [Oscillospiraceae bacterium]|nr:50S ribosomal protein L29 [Oscillospiraceae bacterium]